MMRTTITIDDKLLEEIEKRFGNKEFLNFSAIVRNLLRKSLELDEDDE